MSGAIDVIRCEISKAREPAAFLALKYINTGFPMYVTLKHIPTYNRSPVKGLMGGAGINVNGKKEEKGNPDVLHIPLTFGNRNYIFGST